MVIQGCQSLSLEVISARRPPARRRRAPGGGGGGGAGGGGGGGGGGGARGGGGGEMARPRPGAYDSRARVVLRFPGVFWRFPQKESSWIGKIGGPA
ncbi:MAG TPA: hypothetical protein DDZ83_00745 [Nitrospinae bacterium]|nr:hypothetical protein [Nitrospinota bacterium]